MVVEKIFDGKRVEVGEQLRKSLWSRLKKIPGFSQLSMDSQGEIYCHNAENFCPKCGWAWPTHNDDGSCVDEAGEITNNEEDIDHDRCPLCGSENMEWPEGFESTYDRSGYYEAICLDCGFEGRQWHRMKFDCWQELKADGSYEDIEIDPNRDALKFLEAMGGEKL